MKSTPRVERLRRAARQLHRALGSSDPETARSAAARFIRLRPFSDLGTDTLIARRTDVRLKHAFAVIAEESGFPTWAALVAADALGHSELDDQVRCQAVEAWLAANAPVLRQGGLLDGDRPVPALANELREAPLGRVSNGVPTFDLQGVSGRAYLRHLGCPVEASGVADQPAAAGIAQDEIGTAEIWCYARPGDGTAHRIDWSVIEAIEYGRRPAIDPAWRSPEGSLLFACVVILRIAGIPRFIERACGAVWGAPVLVFGGSAPVRVSTPAEDWTAVMTKVLSEAGADTVDAPALAHLMTDVRALVASVSLDGWYGAAFTDAERETVVDAAMSPDRTRLLWDLARGEPVLPGIPVRHPRSVD
mgnify:CR=1 FL=1